MLNQWLFLRENAEQQGVFSNVDIKKGEMIFVFKGELLDEKELPEEIVTPEQDRYIQVSETEFLGPSGDLDDYFNHSCDPNVGVIVKNKNATLFAIKDIKKEDEIVWDYSTTMFNDVWTMQCECGSPICRRVIKEFKYLPPDIKKKYISFGIVPDYNLDQ